METLKNPVKLKIQPAAEQGDVADQTKESGSISDSQSIVSNNVKRKRRGTKLTAFSDSDLKGDSMTMDDRVKLVAEKEELLKAKYKEIKDNALRRQAEMKNVMDRK